MVEATRSKTLQVLAMTVEEALEIIHSVVDQGHLSKVQEIVSRQSWKDCLTEIAKSSGYEVGYIRDVGSKLWQSLSKALGRRQQKITPRSPSSYMLHVVVLQKNGTPRKYS